MRPNRLRLFILGGDGGVADPDVGAHHHRHQRTSGRGVGEYDVRGPDLAQRFAAHYNAKYLIVEGQRALAARFSLGDSRGATSR